MPMTHVAMRRGKPAHYRTQVLKSIHQALHESFGIHRETFFMTVTEHDEADFLVNMTYPFPRSSDLLLIQITVTAGRQ